MTTKPIFFALGAAGILVVILSVPNSHQPVLNSSTADQIRPTKVSVRGLKENQSTQTNQTSHLAVTEPQQETDSFELIEKKYAELNLDQARQEVRRIDHEARKVALKKFDDFSNAERVTFLNRQREKAVLLNKIILARLERIRK